jgi:hypothetical protein
VHLPRGGRRWWRPLLGPERHRWRRTGRAPAAACCPVPATVMRGEGLRVKVQVDLRRKTRGLVGAGVVQASLLGSSPVMESGGGGLLDLEPCAREGSEARGLGAREASGQPSGARHARRERAGAQARGAWPGPAQPVAWARCMKAGAAEGPQNMCESTKTSPG